MVLEGSGHARDLQKGILIDCNRRCPLSFLEHRNTAFSSSWNFLLLESTIKFLNLVPGSVGASLQSWMQYDVHTNDVSSNALSLGFIQRFWKTITSKSNNLEKDNAHAESSFGLVEPNLLPLP